MQTAAWALGRATLLLALLGTPAAARGPEVRELGRVEIGFADPPGQLTPPRVNLPYFSYRDDSARRHVLVRYRILPPGGP